MKKAKEAGKETGGWLCAEDNAVPFSGSVHLIFTVAHVARVVMPTWQMRKPKHRVKASQGPQLGFSAGPDLSDPRFRVLSLGPHRNLGIWSSGGA